MGKKNRNKHKKKIKKLLNESNTERIIRLAKIRGGRCTMVITDKKKYSRKTKHKNLEE
jgi:hypothetical protein